MEEFAFWFFLFLGLMAVVGMCWQGNRGARGSRGHSVSLSRRSPGFRLCDPVYLRRPYDQRRAPYDWMDEEDR